MLPGLPLTVGFIMPVAVVAGAWLGGAWTFLPVAVLYIAMRAIDAVAGLNPDNPGEADGAGQALAAVAPGRYEPVMPWHSWISGHRVSNGVLINLARHADHHVGASKRYQVLAHLDGAPQLPAGSGTMVLLAMVLSMWRRVMHPRVDTWRAWYGGAQVV